MYLWRKIVRSVQTDVWKDQILITVDPQRLAIVSVVGGRTDRLEVYCISRLEAEELTARFGGQIRELVPEQWQPAPVTSPGRPLSIGRRLLVTSRETELAPLRAARPDRHVLCIPAAMAFGTGEHATTAMCLRLLSEVAQRRASQPWDMLDLGTGSGILALAGRMFGARAALGLDHDPHAVRTARQNARLNRLASRAVRFDRADLLTRTRPDLHAWNIVTANLFSELLIRLLPDTILHAVAPGGDLILSGVLATQADEVVASVRTAGFSLNATKSRGRWRAFHCRRLG